MGWLTALGVLILLASIPLGVLVRYDEDGPLIKLVLGPGWLTLYPRPKKEKKEKPKQEKTPKPAQKAAPKPQKPKEEKKGGSLWDFLPLVKVGLDLMNDFRRKLRVNILELKLTLAGDDPCDLATNYGRAWAALGNLWPRLERFLVIQKRDVEIQCDFTASETKVYARLKLTITLGRILALGAVYGFRALKEFLIMRKKRKGGAVS